MIALLTARDNGLQHWSF